jgi:hypothetical protein
VLLAMCVCVMVMMWLKGELDGGTKVSASTARPDLNTHLTLAHTPPSPSQPFVSSFTMSLSSSYSSLQSAFDSNDLASVGQQLPAIKVRTPTPRSDQSSAVRVGSSALTVYLAPGLIADSVDAT